LLCPYYIVIGTKVNPTTPKNPKIVQKSQKPAKNAGGGFIFPLKTGLGVKKSRGGLDAINPNINKCLS
tara:strand:+ start:4174 stop:4377 length:204 start_codon:yes stop_codon:yes gene_type:complete